MVMLADGTASEWNQARYLNAAVLSRHLIETLAGWYRILDQIHVTLLPKKEIRQIYVLVMKALFGRKDGDPALPEATNVLTCISRLEAAYPPIRNVYNQLSEFAHPNSDGHWTFGSLDEKGVLTLTEMGRDDGLRGLVLGAAGCLHFAVQFLEGYDLNIRGPLETLEREFGNEVAAWPGDPSITWQRA